MNSVRKYSRLRSRVAAIAFVTALGLMSFASTPALAQDDDSGHPAHIHIGTCAELGEVAWALSNVGPGTVRNGTPSTGGSLVGQLTEIYPVDVSSTTVETPLQSITDGTHAINVHESVANIQNYIACGNIGGTQYGNTLVVGLGELNDSGYSGIAVLRADGDQTVVTVYLSEAESTTVEGEAATPDESDATEEPADSDVAPVDAFVDISDFTFGPGTLEIAAGTTVTWTNNDGAPHTVTSDDGAFDSGTLDTGASFSVTFDTPGTYTYHCEIHPGMTATIIVT